MKILKSHILLISILGLFQVIASARVDYESDREGPGSDREGRASEREGFRPKIVDTPQLNGPPLRDRLRNRPKCPTQRIEHEVIMKKYSDSTGYWVLYTQIIETQNVANKCNRNEYTYLAHRQKSGWFWNSKYNSLVQYSLGEAQFISRLVKRPSGPNHSIMVNMNKKYVPQVVDYDRIFPKKLANSLISIGPNDLKWFELAKQFLPILQMTDAHFQLIKAGMNFDVDKLQVLNDKGGNINIFE